MATERDRASRTPPRFAAVGAGRMGRGIALAFAYAGHRVALLDLRRRDEQAWSRLAAEVAAEIEGALRGLVELGVLDPARLADLAGRIELVRAPGAADALAAADMVFECVPETLDAKREAFECINRHCAGRAILTSTTSSLPVDEMAKLVDRPERFMNMHWLNPAYVIPVVELSCHAGTDPQVLARTRDILGSIGKQPVVCGPSAGYIVPRLQALIMNEAARMVEEGAATPEDIDRATRYGLGLRFAALGVVEFIDFGGCDILHHASRAMADSLDPQRYAAPAIIGDMMAQGRLGLKTGSGFYAYEGRDLAAYRRDVLERTVGMVRHAGLFRPPSDETLS